MDDDVKVAVALREFMYGLVVLGLIAIGVVVSHGIVSNTLLEYRFSVGNLQVALGIFYVNALSLAIIVLLTYYYIVYGRDIIPLMSRIGGIGKLIRVLYDRVTSKWSITSLLIVALVFIVSFIRTTRLIGLNVAMNDMVKALLLPHTQIELIVVYLALWGTAKLGKNTLSLILLTLTLSLMLVASAIIEVTLSPILLYYYELV